MFLFIDLILINREKISIKIILKNKQLLIILFLQAIFAWLENSIYNADFCCDNASQLFSLFLKNFSYI
jgi:hypothetical protein